MLAGIQNWTNTTRDIVLRLELSGGRSIDEKTTSIAAGDVKSVLFSINADRLDGEVINLNLVDVGDDFDLDNSVWAILKC